MKTNNRYFSNLFKGEGMIKEQQLQTYALAFLNREIQEIKQVLQDNSIAVVDYQILNSNLKQYEKDYEELLNEQT